MAQTVFQTLGGGSGGGGGGALKWIEGETSPTPSIANNMLIYAYAADLSNDQSLYALVKVPESYSPGTRIYMKFPWYAAGTSLTVLIQAITTLIRKDVDAITTTTNQHTSTNAALTLSSPANEAHVESLDLTAAGGTINSVAVSAGDLLLVRVTRDTSDTYTGDANALPDSAEVTFT